MLNESQIQAQLARYISGDLSYGAFEKWLIDAMFERYLDNPQAARDLAANIRLRMFEYIDGDIDEATLKDELMQVSSPPSAMIVVPVLLGDITVTLSPSQVCDVNQR